MASVMKEFEALLAPLRRQRALRRGALRALPRRSRRRCAREWRAQFDAWQQRGDGRDVAARARDRGLRATSRAGRGAAPRRAAAADDEKSLKVLQFIRAHRVMGSRYSQLDPLKRLERTPVPELELSYYGLGEADMDREFSPGSWQGAKGAMKLRDIVAAVKKTYCGTIGIEYMYISSTEREALDPASASRARSRTPQLLRRSRRRGILERITAAETLERYLHTRYVGPEALLGRGRREHDPDARHDDRERRRAGREGSRDRHGAPRAPQRAREQPRQDSRGPVRRVRGQARRTSCRRAT